MVKKWGAVLAVLLLALGLRAYGITFGAPFDGFYWWDERAAITKAAETASQLGPSALENGLYPLLLGAIYYPLSVIQHQTWNPRAIHILSLNSRILIGRAFTALTGTALVAVIYAVGRRVAGKRSGLLAALLTAVSPTLVAESRYATTGMPVTLLVYATLLPLSSQSMGLWKRLTFGSVIAGLAVLTKPNGIAAFYFPLAAGLLAVYTLFRSKRHQGSIVAGVVLTLIAVLAGLVAAMRLSGSTGLLEYLYSASSYARIHRPGASPLDAWQWLLRYEWPLLLGGTAGIAVSVVRQERVKGFLQLSTFLVAYSMTSLSFGTFFIRWLMVILPGLAILTGWAISRASSGDHQQWQRALVGVVASIGVSFGALTTWHMGHNLINDVRLPAWQWVQQHIPGGAKLAIEPHALPAGTAVSTRYRLLRVRRTTDYPPSYYVEQGCDYILTADDIYDRWQADPEAHRTAMGEYQELFDEFEEVAAFHGTLLHIPPAIEVRVLRVPGVPVYPRGNLVLGEGWHGIEVEESSGIEFRWMTERGQVFYNWSGSGSSRQVLSCDAYVFRDKEEISVLVNGERAGSLSLGSPGGLHQAELPIMLSPGLNEIQLISERGCGRPIVFNPDSRDKRCLSIKVADLALEPVQ
ncbi:MAG: glycosyltransferase family 39 protein [Chloroflexota bacterium]|nr:glycosyltransferase family 39 protein [Chloroflexota bacterium]